MSDQELPLTLSAQTSDPADRDHLPVRLAPPPVVPGGVLRRAQFAAGRLPKGAILFGPAVLLVVWEIASAAGWLSPKFLAAPSTAVSTSYDLLVSGTLADHFLASAVRAYAGLGIGVALGLALALAAGLSRTGEASIDGLIQIKRAVPTLALIPLAILWLGIGEAMKIALIASSVLIPVYINTHAALRGIDIRYVELARSVGITRAEFVREIALPLRAARLLHRPPARRHDMLDGPRGARADQYQRGHRLSHESRARLRARPISSWSVSRSTRCSGSAPMQPCGCGSAAPCVIARCWIRECDGAAGGVRAAASRSRGPVAQCDTSLFRPGGAARRFSRPGARWLHRPLSARAGRARAPCCARSPASTMESTARARSRSRRIARCCSRIRGYCPGRVC